MIAEGSERVIREWVTRKRRYTYRVTYETESNRLDIYDDGTWEVELPQVGGRSRPPHSRAWIRKLIAKGMTLEMAMMHVMEWQALKEGK